MAAMDRNVKFYTGKEIGDMSQEELAAMDKGYRLVARDVGALPKFECGHCEKGAASFADWNVQFLDGGTDVFLCQVHLLVQVRDRPHAIRQIHRLAADTR